MDDFPGEHEFESTLVGFTRVRRDFKLARTNLRMRIVNSNARRVVGQDHLVKHVADRAMERVRRGIQRFVKAKRSAGVGINLAVNVLLL